MKNMAVVSERGTITIPKPIRNRINIHPRDMIEFVPHKDEIILRHLIVKRPSKEEALNDSDWREFDKLVKKQLKHREYTSYENIDQAKLHSRSLIRKTK